MSKPLFVCVACAQDFTRESDAKRHNSNHHLSKAKILSFLEYLIGRTNGTLPPPSQTPPRLSAKNKKMMLDRKDSDEQKNATLQGAAAATTPQDSPRTPPEHIEKDILRQPSRYGLKINTSLHNTGTPSCCCEDRIRKANKKLFDLEVLLCPYADPTYVKNLIESIVRRCNEFGDYDHVDECYKNHLIGILDGRWHWYPNKRT